MPPARRSPYRGAVPPADARARNDVVDALLALVLLCGITAITQKIRAEPGQRGVEGWTYLVIVVAAGVLAVRRRFPVAVLAVNTTALIAYLAMNYPGGPVYATFFVAVAAVAMERERRVAAMAVGVSTFALLAVAFRVQSELHSWWTAVVMVSWITALLVGGQAHRGQLIARADREREREEARAEESRREVAEERLRIARDLHDVVAHSIASINVQAGAAAHIIDRHPEQAKEALVGIQQTTKQALQELRVTLDLLREGSEAAPKVPLLRLSQLDALVDSSTRSGLHVDLVVEGAPRPLAPEVDTAGYRIVQESLTNVTRHAHASQARIAINYGPDVVEIEVVDNGSTTPAPTTTGLGITGMRERADAVGGQIEAAPRPEGGFRVWARLPSGAIA